MLDTFTGNVLGFFAPGWTLFVVYDMVCALIAEESAFGLAGRSGDDLSTDRFGELIPLDLHDIDGKDIDFTHLQPK